MLPAGTYIKGFLRSYAEFLGLDGQLYVDEYNSRNVVDSFDDMPQRRPHRRHERSFEKKVVFLALAGIAALTGLVIVAWRFGGSDTPTSTPAIVTQQRLRCRRPVFAFSASARGRYLEVRRATAPGAWSSRERYDGATRSSSSASASGSYVAPPRRCPLLARRQAGLPARTPQPQGRRHADEDSARRRLSRPRVVVVVTGSELVRGDRTDLNGPFLAREALRLGLEPARIAIVGDAPAELEATLRDALEADAVLVSGGLGPTHDDRTVELVAKALGVGLRVDPELEREIEAVSRSAATRLKRDYADFAPGVTKQATIPEGALSLGLAGTAPGLVVPRDGGRVVVVLPGPPSELQRLWPRALETEASGSSWCARRRRSGESSGSSA